MAEMNAFARWLVDVRTDARARRVLARLDGHLPLPPAARLLELGSGGGGMLAHLQERFRPAALVGTDFDPVQVEAARRFLRARWGSVPSTIEVRPADALALPFPDRSFDAVFALMMLHHVEADHSSFVRRPAALREVRRVLRAGGLFVYSEIFARRPLREALSELGFVPEYVRSSWRSDLAVYRSAREPG